MLQSYDGAFMMPGQLPSIEAVEQELTSVIWQPLYRCIVGANRAIAGAARDTGNTNFTDVLRPGLLLTKNAAGNFVPWGSVEDFETDKIEGVLLISMKMQRVGQNVDRFMGHIMLGGPVKVNGLIVPGQTTAGIVGHAQETWIRQQMVPAFQFDDDPVGHLGKFYPEEESGGGTGGG